MEFLSARLRGRRRRVYEGDRLRELARAAHLGELCERLYPREPVAGRLELERRLRRDCVEELASVLHFLSPPFHHFYAALIRRFQVDNIVVLLRLFAGGGEAPSREDYLTELPGRLSVPAGELLASGSIEEFIAQLPVDLARAARGAVALDKRAETTAFTEMALAREYWEGVTAAFAALSGADREACAGPVLSELAAARLLMVLRAARNYDLEWDRLKPLLPRNASTEDGPSGISAAALEALHGDPSPANVARQVGLVRTPAHAEDLVDLEELLWERTYRMANRIYYSVMDGPAVAVGYFYVRRNELKALVHLAEAIHYGSPAGAA